MYGVVQRELRSAILFEGIVELIVLRAIRMIARIQSNVPAISIPILVKDILASQLGRLKAR